MGSKITLRKTVQPGDTLQSYAHRAEQSEGEAARRLLEDMGFPAKSARPKAGQYEFRCPFHEGGGEVPRNKSANFYVDAESSKYVCHSASCGERGNLTLLERYFGISTEEQGYFRTKEVELQEYESALTRERRELLKRKQGINDATIDRFRLGYDPLGQNYVIPYLRGRRPIAFRFYSPEGNGPNGSKYWWERGAESTLYNASDGVGDDKGRVFICEGEFETMIVTQLGYCAVGVPGARIFKDDWHQHLNNARQIVVCFDNDNPEEHVYEKCHHCKGECQGHNPGQEAATDLAEKLGWRAKSVTLPRPEGERKVDINDFFVRDGGSASEFAHITLGEKRSRYKVKTFAEIMENPPEETSFLVDGVLPQASRLLVAGKPKVGKSIFIENMALSLAAGIPFLGRFGIDHPTRVLVLDRELSKRSFYDRIHALFDYRPGYRAAAENMCVDHEELLKLDLKGSLEVMLQLIAENGVEVVFFDTAYKFFAKNMLDASVSKAFEVLDRIIMETGVSVVLTHHLRKGSKGEERVGESDEVAGSFLWTGWPNGTIQLNYLNRSVENPFNAICSFTDYRDCAPPEPLALYRSRDSIAYQVIKDYTGEGEVPSSNGRRESIRPTTEAVANLLLELTPCTEDQFMEAACNHFRVNDTTVRPYVVDVLQGEYAKYFEKSGKPAIIRYVDPVDEESWEQGHLTLVKGDDDG